MIHLESIHAGQFVYLWIFIHIKIRLVCLLICSAFIWFCVNQGNYINCFVFFWQDEIGLKEWALSLRSAHKLSQELLGSMARKAGKIYGTERDATSKSTMINSSNSGGGGGGGGNIGGGVGSTTAIGGGLGSATSVTSKNTNGSN